ncbi:hypothetical protein [Haloferax profundi]|uniref:hypothetical protein n=1 Tax=Haloferax profundi TaxID=1544718 RepID=UPI0018D22801|nr:hypothetical protein [Haloferax profundi]
MAGLYVAALLSPALVLVVVQEIELTSWSVAVGSLGVVGAVLTAVVARRVIRQGDLVGWFDSTWVAVLVPAVGIIPMGVYLFDSFLFVAFAVTDLQAASTTTLVSFIGFFLGIVATSLGSHLVLMARTRLANATVDDTDVLVEWAAAWPHRARLKFMTGALAVVGLLAGLAFWQLGWRAVTPVLPFGMVLVIGLRSLASKRTYRATSAGLEQRREGRWFVPRRLIPWSTFDAGATTSSTTTRQSSRRSRITLTDKVHRPRQGDHETDEINIHSRLTVPNRTN